MDDPLRPDRVRRAIRVSALSVVWNVFCAISAGGTAAVVGSLALAGLGLDAVVDGAGSGMLLWRFRSERREPAIASKVERLATRAIGVILILIGVYLVLSAVHALTIHSGPDRSVAAIGISVASLVVLPPLAHAKRRLATQLDSRALHGDGLLSAVGAALAATALLGLILTTVFGLWWADSAAALLMAAVLSREAVAALRSTAGRA